MRVLLSGRDDGLRAASLGVPFEPVPGLRDTDLLATADFRTVKDPWTLDPDRSRDLDFR